MCNSNLKLVLIASLIYIISSVSYSVQDNSFMNSTKWYDLSTSTYILTYLVDDFDGDLLDDVLIYKTDYEWMLLPSNGIEKFANTFYENAPSILFPSPYIFPTPFEPVTDLIQSGTNGTLLSGDFNNDGLADKLRISYESNGYRFYVAFTERNTDPRIFRFTNEMDWGFEATYSTFTNFNVCDINGDGSDDVVFYYNSKIYFKLSNYSNQFNPISSNFRTKQVWTNGNANKFWVGDFNGDGYFDRLIFKNNSWRVQITDNSSLLGSVEENWYQYPFDDTAELSTCIIGDFNGDSYADIAYNKNSEWWVLLAKGIISGGFWQPLRWAIGQGFNSGAWVGDFNGDGKQDIVTRSISNNSYYNGFWVSLSSNAIPKKVGIWWYGSYVKEGPQWDQRDHQKEPIVGWGNISQVDTVRGIYTSPDNDIIRLQIRAMQKANIDFIISNATDGWYPLSPAIQKSSGTYEGDGTVKNATIELFDVMNSFPSEERLPIAISLGAEVWGPDTFEWYSWNWDGWDQAKLRLNNSVEELRTRFTTNTVNENLYFNYLGKPLLLIYLERGDNFPPNQGVLSNQPIWQNNDITNVPLWHYNDFTIRHAVSWNTTFTSWKQEGIERKRFWGWGSGAADTAAESTKLLPNNYEVMHLLPGTTKYNEGGVNLIDRRDGQYYIDQWKQILLNDPKMVLIANWNNWNEETGIEGCVDVDGQPTVGGNGWNDLNGNARYDWYLQITRAYAELYKDGTLMPQTYYQIDDDANVKFWSGFYTLNKGVGFKPNGFPIIQIPANFIFTKRSSSINKNSNLNANEDNPTTILDFKIEQNYPNPFNPNTRIKYSIPHQDMVHLKIIDILGREIKVLVNEEQMPGEYEINFNAHDLTSGLYFYRITAGKYTETKKMILVK